MPDLNRGILQQQLELMRHLEVLRERILRGPVDPEDIATLARLREQFEINQAKLDAAARSEAQDTVRSETHETVH